MNIDPSRPNKTLFKTNSNVPHPPTQSYPTNSSSSSTLPSSQIARSVSGQSISFNTNTGGENMSSQQQQYYNQNQSNVSNNYQQNQSYNQVNQQQQYNQYNQSYPQSQPISNGQSNNGQINNQQTGYNQPMYQNQFQQAVNDPSKLLGNFAPMTQVGYDLTQDIIKKQMEKLNGDSYISMMRSYFNVNNSYVLRKLKIILFPTSHTAWARSTEATGEFSSPRHDINAPDLYIPTMALITYILLYSYILGYENKFSPEKMINAGWSAFMIILLEVVGLKLAFYLMFASNIITPAILDLVAYVGYIFVGCIVCQLVLFFGYTFFYIAVFFCGLMMAIFLMRTLSHVVSSTVADDGGAHIMRRNILMIFGLFQILFMYWLTLV